MVSAFFRLRKATEKKPQLIYVGIRFGIDQLIVSTGIKVLPKHWDFDKCDIKQNITCPEIKLPALLREKSNGKDIRSFTSAYLGSLKELVNSKSSLSKEALKMVVQGFINGRNDLEQFAHDLDFFVRSKITETPTLDKGDLTTIIIDYLTPKVERVTLFDYIQQLIVDSENGRRLIDGKQVNTRTVQRYQTTFKLLSDFQTKYKTVIDFDAIDLDFYKDFSSYMAKTKDYTPATMGKHVSTLKTFLNVATQEGINVNLKYQSKGFKAIETESDSIHLNESEILEIERLDLSANPRLDHVRDLFLIGCYTGLRYSDFTTIQPKDIRQGKDGEYLDIIQFKTKGRVEIAIHRTVRAILDKYHGQLPEAISNQKFNDYLKEVAEMVESLQVLVTRSITKGGKTIEDVKPKWQLVSSHTGRRSYATNEYERGTPTLSIMDITGHRTERSFLGYVKTSASKHAEIRRRHQN
jgi:integrase